MGLGEAIITKLYDACYKTIIDFLQLKISDIIIIEGFKQKSAQNIVDSIKKSTTNILIVKDINETNTSKAIKANELGITIYTIDDFNKKYKFN